MIDRTELMKKVGTWTIATVAAALLGALIKTAYDRAVPHISIVQIRPSIEANNSFDMTLKEVKVPDALKRAAEKTLWASIAGFRGQFTDYKHFNTALGDNEQSLLRVSNSISSFQRDKQRMREIIRQSNTVSDDEAVEFFDLWESNDGFIYGSLRGKFRRGSFGLVDQTYDGLPKLIVRQDDDKDWYVTRKGGRFNSELIKQSSMDGALQEEVAKSLAFFKRERLLDYLKLVEEDAGDVDPINQVLSEIQSAKTSISRLTVTVQVENSGSTAISFIPYAALEIDTKGLIQSGKPLEGKTVIPMEYRSGTPGEPTAIQVAANSSQLLTLSSSLLIGDFPNSVSIVKILDLGTSKCVIRMSTAGGDAFVKGSYQSPPFTFSKLEPFALKS